MPDDPRVSLRPMFGNLAAFANGYLFTGLFGDDVFVRADAAGQARDHGGRRRAVRADARSPDA